MSSTLLISLLIASSVHAKNKNDEDDGIYVYSGTKQYMAPSPLPGGSMFEKVTVSASKCTELPDPYGLTGAEPVGEIKGCNSGATMLGGARYICTKQVSCDLKAKYSYLSRNTAAYTPYSNLDFEKANFTVKCTPSEAEIDKVMAVNPDERFKMMDKVCSKISAENCVKYAIGFDEHSNKNNQGTVDKVWNKDIRRVQ